MLSSLFSHAEHPPVVFTVLLATPEMAVKREFYPATVLGGTTDAALPSEIYAALRNARVYGLRFAGGKTVPLAVPVPREKLATLYHLLLNCDDDCASVLSWFGTEPLTVDDMVAAVREKAAA